MCTLDWTSWKQLEEKAASLLLKSGFTLEVALLLLSHISTLTLLQYACSKDCNVAVSLDVNAIMISSMLTWMEYVLRNSCKHQYPITHKKWGKYWPYCLFPLNWESSAVAGVWRNKRSILYFLKERHWSVRDLDDVCVTVTVRTKVLHLIIDPLLHSRH